MDVFDGDEERSPFGGFEEQGAECVERARLDRFRAQAFQRAARVDPPYHAEQPGSGLGRQIVVAEVRSTARRVVSGGSLSRTPQWVRMRSASGR